MTVHLSTLSSNGLEGTPTGSGAQYVLMSTWEAAQQSNHGAGDQSILECYKGTTTEGSWDADGYLVDDQFTIQSWANLTADDYVQIKAAAGEQFTGPSDGFALLHTASGSNTNYISIRQQHTHISGVRFLKRNLTDFSNPAVGLFNGSDFNIIDSCWFENINCGGNSGVYNAIGTSVDQGYTDIQVRNCVFVNVLSVDYPVSTGNRVVHELYPSHETALVVRNCTFYGCAYVGAYATFENCAAFNSTVGDFDTPTSITQTGTNASSDATAAGPGSVINLVATDVFTDPANGDFTVVTGQGLDGAVNPANDLSGTFTNDITGATRSVPWEIGAYEIAAAALTFSLSPDSSPLPAGLSVNATTGNIEGTPTESGTFPNIIIRGST
jgi:hypothetical protein